MSRIGKLPIDIPAGVKVAMSKNIVSVEGQRASLSRTFTRKQKLSLKITLLLLKRWTKLSFPGLYTALQGHLSIT